MNLVQKKSFSILMTFALLVSLITPSFAQAYTVKGSADNPTLTIHKFEQEKGTAEGKPGTGEAGQTAEGKGLPGVEFTLTQTDKYNAETDKWEAVSDGKVLKKVTNDQGEIVLTKADGLELGRYEVQETDGPDHVILNTKKYSVDLPMTNKEGTELNYDVHIYPKNEIIRGDGELIKKSENGEVLEGVKFGLFKENGEKVTELTTDSDGKIKFENLEFGKYYVQELKTVEGHAINTNKISFEVVSGKQGKIAWTPVDGYVDVEHDKKTDNQTGVVTNYKQPEVKKDVEEKERHSVDRNQTFTYNITIKTPGDINNYSVLGVTDILDDRLEYAGTWSVTGTNKDNIEFTKNGQKLEWKVKDLSKLTPNTDIKVAFTAKIKKDAELNPGETGIPNKATLEFNNDKGSYTDPKDPPTTPPVTVDPTEGGLKVVKVDKSDHDIKLEGAEFKLTRDKEGKEVVDTTGTVIKVNGKAHEGKLENLATNKDGEISITGLTPGTYYLNETKAPTYTDEDGNEKAYRLLTKPLEVKVENKVNDSEVKVENAKSGWDLPTTGGIGTVLFTAIGLALMAFALFMLLRRKKETA